jgi:hypothetical protein
MAYEPQSALQYEPEKQSLRISVLALKFQKKGHSIVYDIFFYSKFGKGLPDGLTKESVDTIRENFGGKKLGCSKRVNV